MIARLSIAADYSRCKPGPSLSNHRLHDPGLPCPVPSHAATWPPPPKYDQVTVTLSAAEYEEATGYNESQVPVWLARQLSSATRPFLAQQFESRKVAQGFRP